MWTVICVLALLFAPPPSTQPTSQPAQPSTTSTAATLPRYVLDYIEQAKAQQVKDIDDLHRLISKAIADLELAKDGAITTVRGIPSGSIQQGSGGKGRRYVFSNKKLKDAAVQVRAQKLRTLNNELAEIKRGDHAHQPRLIIKSAGLSRTPAIAVGQIGSIECFDARGDATTPKILQIIDGNNVLVSVTGLENPLWFKGGTTGLVDGQLLKFEGFYRVSGTKTYETGIGTNTTFVIEPVDIAPYEAEIRAALIEQGGG